MTGPDKSYYGEFSDSWAKTLQEDDRVEVLDVEDGDWGLNQGTKFITFKIKNDEEWDYDPPIKSVNEIREAYKELQQISRIAQEIIPANIEAVSETLAWVLGEKEELPEIVEE